jgi:hypothetical protein
MQAWIMQPKMEETYKNAQAILVEMERVLK